MARPVHNALLVGFNEETGARLQAALESAGWPCEPATSNEALELAFALPFSALLVAFPLPELSAQRFVGLMRRPDSASRHAGLVLLADRPSLETAAALLISGVNRVLPVDEPIASLIATLVGLTRPATRIPLRTLVRLELSGDVPGLRMLCQTANVSSTGMLVRVDERIPLGSAVDFQLTLPGADAPVCGRAEVVRHALPRRERMRGVGLRFATLQDDHARRLSAELARLENYTPREKTRRSWPA